MGHPDPQYYDCSRGPLLCPTASEHNFHTLRIGTSTFFFQVDSGM